MTHPAHPGTTGLQVRTLFKGRKYSRAETWGNTVPCFDKLRTVNKTVQKMNRLKCSGKFVIWDPCCSVLSIGTSKLQHWGRFENTLFPQIVSVETILFWIWLYVLWPLVTVHKSAETIQRRKLFRGWNYLRKYTRYNYAESTILEWTSGRFLRLYGNGIS